MGRTDVPSDQPWQTALHKAAEDGHLELARTLLRLGADPDVRDHRFGSTPLGWARLPASRGDRKWFRDGRTVITLRVQEFDKGRGPVGLPPIG